jgi:AcrR family transcriptional regulator
MARDKEERRRQILDAALEEFSEAGYHSTKVSDIVARAGIAQGTFYLYFKDKRSIFEELLGTFFHKISSSITRIDVGQPVFEQIQENVHRILSVLVAERRFTKILLLDAVGLEASLDHRLSTFWEELTARITTPLQEGQELGLVREGDMHFAAIMIVGAIKELTLQCLLKDEHAALAPIEKAVIEHNLFGILNPEVLRR